MVHVRHHSNHGNSNDHDDPHDHTGFRTKDGHNTHTRGPEPVDENYKSPKQTDVENTGVIETHRHPIALPKEQRMISETSIGVAVPVVIAGSWSNSLHITRHCLI